jgi:hypothetical protein
MAARNSFVHQGTTDPYIDDAVAALKTYVEKIIEYMLYSRVRYDSHAELLEIMSYGSYDIDQLECRFGRMGRALGQLRKGKGLFS